jgi:hypothetical protein
MQLIFGEFSKEFSLEQPTPVQTRSYWINLQNPGGTVTENAEHVDFWRGVVVGTLFGLVAAAYARGDFKRLLSLAPIDEPQPVPQIQDSSHTAS